VNYDGGAGAPETLSFNPEAFAVRNNVTSQFDVLTSGTNGNFFLGGSVSFVPEPMCTGVALAIALALSSARSHKTGNRSFRFAL
jgi:hypothetical protein